MPAGAAAVTATYAFADYTLSVVSGIGDGTYELSDTGQLSAQDEYIGYYSRGTFIQTGGTNTISQN
ncbi:hypothetical protein LCGC14_2421720, partial [marine sediment metagenome]